MDTRRSITFCTLVFRVRETNLPRLVQVFSPENLFSSLSLSHTVAKFIAVPSSVAPTATTSPRNSPSKVEKGREREMRKKVQRLANFSYVCSMQRGLISPKGLERMKNSAFEIDLEILGWPRDDKFIAGPDLLLHGAIKVQIIFALDPPVQNGITCVFWWRGSVDLIETKRTVT